jgi:hypothetical protein
VSADYNDAADHLVRKPAALQEAGAPGALLERCGGQSVLASQDLARALDFAGARAGSGARGRLFGDPLGAQVVRDARGAVLAPKLARPRLGIPLIR